MECSFGARAPNYKLAERGNDIDEAFDTTRLIEYIKEHSIAEKNTHLIYFPASERGKTGSSRQGRRIEYPLLYLNGSLRKSG